MGQFIPSSFYECSWGTYYVAGIVLGANNTGQKSHLIHAGWRHRNTPYKLVKHIGYGEVRVIWRGGMTF